MATSVVDQRKLIIMLLVLPQIIVCLVKPVLSRRAEDINVESIFKRFHLMQDARGYVQHLPGAYFEDSFFIFANPETERAFKDISELLIIVRMSGNNRPLLEVYVS